jgi:hypothetical protein
LDHLLEFVIRDAKVAFCGGDVEVEFVYDGDDRMVKRIIEDLTTIFIGSYFEVDIKPYVTYLPLVARQVGPPDEELLYRKQN